MRNRLRFGICLHRLLAVLLQIGLYGGNKHALFISLFHYLHLVRHLVSSSVDVLLTAVLGLPKF